MSNPIRVTIAGSRGSTPVSGEAYRRYGGATCCVLVQHSCGNLILDAGTGLMNLGDRLKDANSVSLLLSHPHFDHMAGLCLFPESFRRDFHLTIYGRERHDLSVRKQIEALMSPPLWPVDPEHLPAKFSFFPAVQHFTAEGMEIETMEGNHPGGVSIFRLTMGGKRIVYMTDCTITEENRENLLAFASDCDLLLCDGQYSDEEWPARSGFGHNPWNEAARFAQQCGAKRARILHHDPLHTDKILDTANVQVRAICPACTLAFDGEEILL